MQSERVQRRVLRSFLGEGATETYRKGQIISLDPQRATQYDAQKLTGAVEARPTKAQAQAASAAAKSMQAAETKERTGEGTKAAGRK